MVAHSRTADQILSTFLCLVAERGLDATATRTLAVEAGVNEVMVFRHFGDKATLAREAVRRFQPAKRIAAYPLAIDAASPERVAAGLLACLRFLRDSLREHPELRQCGLSDYGPFPEVREDVAAVRPSHEGPCHPRVRKLISASLAPRSVRSSRRPAASKACMRGLARGSPSSARPSIAPAMRLGSCEPRSGASTS